MDILPSLRELASKPISVLRGLCPLFPCENEDLKGSEVAKEVLQQYQ